MDYWIIPVGYRAGSSGCTEFVECTAPGEYCYRCIFNYNTHKYTTTAAILKLYREGKLNEPN